MDELAEERRVLALILHLWRFTPSAQLAALHHPPPVRVPERRKPDRTRRYRDADVPLWPVHEDVRHSPAGGHL